MTVEHRPVLPRGAGWLVLAALAIVAVVGIATAAYVIQSNSGAAGGVQNGSAFLSHWQQTAVVSTTTPARVPAALSTTVGAPTRLPATSTPYRVDAATAGDPAAEWVFVESTGIGLNLEIEVEYTVQYTLGAVAHTASGTVYLESQAAAPGADLTFELYWDSGSAAAIELVTESEISQACSAVGSCP
jgi:hypothetical protein